MIKFNELKKFGLSDYDIEALSNNQIFPLGCLFSIIVNVKKDMTENRREYKKISEHYIELVRCYEYS